MNKFCINEGGTRIYLAGLQGCLSVETGSGYSSLNTKVIEATKTQTIIRNKRSPFVSQLKDQIILQDPNQNDLTLNSNSFYELNRLKGNYEPGKVIEHFHDYRHSLDRDYMLWRLGGDDLAVVDRVLFKIVQTIVSFWMIDNQSCMPVCAVSDRKGSRIIASSMSGPSEHILHFWSKQTGLISSPCRQKLPHMLRVTAMEVSKEGNVAFLAGLSISQSTQLSAIKLDSSFESICDTILADLDYSKPRRVVRMKGFNILFVGCKKHIAVYEFEMGGFKKLTILRDHHQFEVTDMVVSSKYLYSKAYTEPYLRVTEFGAYASGSDAGSTRGGFNHSSRNLDDSPSLFKSSASSGDKDLYGKYVMEKIELNSLYDVEKISLSKSGNNIYVGGSTGLQILNRVPRTESYKEYKSGSLKGIAIKN